MADESESAPSLAVEAAATPAAWTAREPVHPWCPDALLPLIPASLVGLATAEPTTVAAHHAPWHLLGASVRGRSHGHRGEYRDDAMATHVDGQLLLLAVADGAGSSPLSRIGAAVTAQVAVERTAARYAADVATGAPVSRLGTAMAHAVHDAALRLHELAAAGEVAPASLRTTLVLVALLGDMMLVSQVGDGAVLVQKRDGTVLRVGAQRETAWAGEVTCFIPDACAMTQAAALRQVSADEVTLVALMTDGIDDPFHPLEQSAAQLVAQWRYGTSTPIGTARQRAQGPVLDHAAALLQWMTFEQRGEVDDRTLLLAWRNGDAG